MNESTTRRTRRAPKPDERQRDAERTRAALLDAALTEFAEHGFAGARVEQIARRAGVNKQLISYYFGGKEGLYRALGEAWLREEAQFATPDLPLDELVARYAQQAVERRELVRLFLRESLEARDPDARGMTQEDLDHMRRRQEAGEVADELDPAILLLVLQAAASVGVAFPADVRRLTGLDSASPEFAERHAEQLRRIVRRLSDA